MDEERGRGGGGNKQRGERRERERNIERGRKRVGGLCNEYNVFHTRQEDPKSSPEHVKRRTKESFIINKRSMKMDG